MTRRDDLARLQAMTVPERIRFLRTRRKNARGRPLSHDDYAKLVSTNRGRVIAWEKGTSSIGVAKAELLAELEGLPIDLFRPDADDAPPSAVGRLERRLSALEQLVAELEADVRGRLGDPPASSASAS